jgi:hypothetical protein
LLIVDTGPLVAAADRKDRDHQACADLIEVAGPLITTALVIAEAGFLIASRVGQAGEAALLEDVVAGRLTIYESTDWRRVHELVEQYADLPLGVTDASVVALAERLRATDVATLDHRHFRVVRPAHVSAFTLRPGRPA